MKELTPYTEFSPFRKSSTQSGGMQSATQKYLEACMTQLHLPEDSPTGPRLKAGKILKRAVLNHSANNTRFCIQKQSLGHLIPRPQRYEVSVVEQERPILFRPSPPTMYMIEIKKPGLT